jgi:hypothetical protein
VAGLAERNPSFLNLVWDQVFEALVILHGSRVANIEGHPDVLLNEKMQADIPPATRHKATTIGTQILEYVWVVPTNTAKP